MTLSYCGETVRKHDPDRFLLSLFSPPERREALWALYAFNHEIAKTREVVTETQLGLIRLQWWRDAIAKIYDSSEILQHQVITPLAGAIKTHGLPRDLFDNLVYAREFDLEDRAPANLDGMVHYADFTSTPLLQLASRIAGESGVGVQEIAAGYALTGILRAVPAHLRQRRCYLPEDLLRAEGLTVYDLYDGSGIEKLKPAIAAVAAVAKKKLSATPPHKFAALHAKLATLYLAQIEKAEYDIFSSRLAVPPFLKELRLWWYARAFTPPA